MRNERLLTWLLSPALALALSACADFGGPLGGSDEPSPEEQRLRRIEAAIDQLNRRVEAISTVDMARQMAQLSDELRQLRGQVEQLRHDVDRNERRARELYLDLDRRLQQLSGAADATAAALPAVPTSAGPADPEEQKAYDAAFELLRSGKVDEAIAAFRRMLERWPEGRFADNAHYWIGEGLYVKRQYEQAIRQFQELLQKYPSSRKVPDALLKTGFAQDAMGQTDAARATLQRVVREFPQSAAASLAKKRLEDIEKRR